jgi:catechol 2,3-dioxygenase-like lactoylglutathione lyase family enzyme
MGGNSVIKGLYEAHLPVSNMERSLEFYQKLGLELAYRGQRLSFMWIEKGKSWLGLWESPQVKLPYHPSIRHLAFEVDQEGMRKARAWLRSLQIEVRESFGVPPEKQPLLLDNYPQVHAAIYFNDPDGNSLELICPLKLDLEEKIDLVELERRFKNGEDF